MVPSERLHLSNIRLTSKCEVETAELTIGNQKPVVLERNGDTFSANLDYVLERKSQVSFCLSVTCANTGYLARWRSNKKEVTFTSSEVLEKSRDNVFRKGIGKPGFAFNLFLASGSGQEVDSGQPSREAFSPTIESILQLCPRFRVLVIGKSGVGKSTLINRAFGIKTKTEDGQRGMADITKGMISDQNNRFILHDSKGFEYGEVDNLDVVTKFIKERRDHQDIKERLHAVWLCFQIPNTDAGQRIMETGMEEFLQKKNEILGNVPTIFVFTKYDMLTTAIEFGFLEQGKNFNSEDVELKAKRNLEERCIQPIQRLTKEKNIQNIAVAAERHYKVEDLIQLTYEKVSECFGNQPGTETSAVPTVAVMAQRVAPDLKIEGSIKVGKERYWKAIFSGRDFSGHSMQDCLRVIHHDIVKLWNFRDDNQLLLSQQFRDNMMQSVALLDRSDDPFDRPVGRGRPQRQTGTAPSAQAFMPFSTGRQLMKWANNFYKLTPEVQRKFMAYIADLTNVLDILFTLTTRRGQENLNVKTIKAAVMAYHKSMRRNQVHTQIESLVLKRYVIDEELMKAIGKITPEQLEGEEDWYSSR